MKLIDKRPKKTGAENDVFLPALDKSTSKQKATLSKIRKLLTYPLDEKDVKAN